GGRDADLRALQGPARAQAGRPREARGAEEARRLMRTDDLPREALTGRRANRLRSVLTLLGIIIGVSTLVGVVSVISGLNSWVEEKVIVLSPDVYVVTKFGIIRSREEFLDALKRRNTSYDDFRRIAGLLRKAEQVGADVNTTSA